MCNLITIDRGLFSLLLALLCFSFHLLRILNLWFLFSWDFQICFNFYFPLVFIHYVNLRVLILLFLYSVIFWPCLEHVEFVSWVHQFVGILGAYLLFILFVSFLANEIQQGGLLSWGWFLLNGWGFRLFENIHNFWSVFFRWLIIV